MLFNFYFNANFITGILMKFNYYYFIGLLIIALHLLIFQSLKLDISNPKSCLKRFKSNNLLGFLVFANILINKINL